MGGEARGIPRVLEAGCRSTRQATPEPESVDLPEEIAPDQLADLVVRQIALPVLVELSTSRPDLVDAIPELSRTLGWVLAERLCAA